MTEADAINASPAPRTRSSLGADLSAIGLASGDIVLVHASLRSLGWVAGGPAAVIQALLDVLGPDGTLVMPAHSGDLSEPAEWQNPPVPAAWFDAIRAEMPAFDPLTTPTRAMGVIAELFRHWPGARRSNHPTTSFAAVGPEAERITAEHRLESPLGEHSPLARLYEGGAKVLLLGVGFDRCTALHLAEQRAWPDQPLDRCAAPILIDGKRVWTDFLAPPMGDSDEYVGFGADLAAAGRTRSGLVGSADTTLLGMREAIDFAVARWRLLSPGTYQAA